MYKDNEIEYLFVSNVEMRNVLGLYRMLNEHFGEDKIHHLIVDRENVYRASQPQVNEFSNVTFFPSKGGFLKQARLVKSMYKRARHIIILGYFFSMRQKLLLLLDKKAMNKVVWINMGSDLYLWEKQSNMLRDRFDNMINFKFRNTVKYAGMPFPSDELFLRENFKGIKKCFYTPMISSRLPLDKLDEILEKPKPPHNKVWIQVGHSIYQRGNHIYLLDMLEKFKKEDIRIVLPLSYGFGNQYAEGGLPYRRAVVNVANQIFGKDNVSVMTKDIPLFNYLEYLSNIDIFVTAVPQPHGLGNIWYLLYLGKKVFMPSGNPTYDFFVNEGFEIYDTLKIPEMTFEEFVKPINHIERKWINDRYDRDKTVKYWEEFFETISNEETL